MATEPSSPSCTCDESYHAVGVHAPGWTDPDEAEPAGSLRVRWEPVPA